MREAGLEPARLAALDPKSSASANFATLAGREFSRPWMKSLSPHPVAQPPVLALPARSGEAPIGVGWIGGGVSQKAFEIALARR